MQKSFGFFRVITVIAIAAVMVFGQEQKLTLDQAIAESMKNIAGKLPAGTKVAVLNIESGSKNLSEYVADESAIYIVNNTKLSIVNKNSGDFNAADESAAAEIGKRIGAASVIFGSVSKIGENYRFRVSAINTANSQIQAAQSLSVAEDAVLRDLLGIKQNAAISVENDLSKQNTKIRLENEADKYQKPAMEIKQAEVSIVKNEGVIGKDEQFVVIKVETNNTDNLLLDIYFNGEFVMKMSTKKDATDAYFIQKTFVLKKGTHTVTLAQSKNYDGTWAIRKIKNASFTLSDNVVELELGTTFTRLEDINVEQISLAQEILHVNTEPNTNRFPNIEVDKKFFLSFKYQQLFDTYIPSLRSSSSYYYYSEIDNALDKTVGKSIPINNFHFEVGAIKYGKVLITGIADISGCGGGGGVSVGRVFSGGEVFKFIPALNLGGWGYKTSYKKDSDFLLDLNWYKINILFGGPELRIMLGYKFIFADLGMKCMMGFSNDYFDVKLGSGSWSSTYNIDYDTHFNAMFGWNIGITATF